MQHHAEAVLVNDVANYLIPHPQHEEVVDVHWPQLGVGEAKELSARAHLRPVRTARQVLVIRTSFITHEAQNALLKLFEEPPASTRFLLVLPRDFQFLPTLRSRVVVKEGEAGQESTAAWDEFLLLTVGDRLKEIETRAKAKDVEWQHAVKVGLLHYLRTAPATLSAQARVRLHFVASQLLTRGASNKMLLEEAALSLPA